MRRYALPMTVVPGAQKDIDPETMLQKQDKRNRPLWVMPKPIGSVETLQVKEQAYKDDDGKVKRKKVKLMTRFPVYRGTSADYARYVRSQMRRALRKAKERAAVERSIEDQILKGA